ncbi:MAG: hypothetical protein NTW20_06590 [Rhodobacterales bacterium]|nr:hypothetical protein [Rhodobacterales bacterium]
MVRIRVAPAARAVAEQMVNRDRGNPVWLRKERKIRSKRGQKSTRAKHRSVKRQPSVFHQQHDPRRRQRFGQRRDPEPVIRAQGFRRRTVGKAVGRKVANLALVLKRDRKPGYVVLCDERLGNRLTGFGARAVRHSRKRKATRDQVPSVQAQGPVGRIRPG